MAWVFSKVQDKGVTVDDFHFLGDMNGGQGVITSDHDAPVGRVGQHLERLDCILFQRAVENQKPSKGQIAFDLVPSEVVYLHVDVSTFTQRTVIGQLYLIKVQAVHLLECKRKHSTTSPGIPLECLIVPTRNGA